ncbi:uncharacterized mitochondrial protein AtMg00810-like [Arachis stenosperma]|uniref:uncharacterized mitochondrial protein AtMg00810-like n=1 Tax=Arachis stenosperma TaxID=217475 RepID=UPI0025ACB96F|nr:uncharacterized mitochondrial protein AtMg00810-like [Arachis stenosperma]
MDVNNAFLNGDLFEEVYMELPLGHKDRNKGLVCKLNRSIYGLRQASRQWFFKFLTALLKNNFKQSRNDYSLFSYGSGTDVVYLLVYVDDIILASASSTMLSNVQKLLQSIFKLKILGDLKYFLGLEIAKSTDGIHLCQRKYTLNLLQDTNFTTCKPTALPMEPNLKLSSTDGTPLSDPSLYRRLVGRLMYLTISRPEITYAVNTLSQFMKSPSSSHMDALHHILRYLKGSPGQGLFFPANSDIRLMAYADSDWAGCPNTRRSVTGYCTFIGNSLISWKSSKQTTISRSSAEAEYRALAAVAAELSWLKRLMFDFNVIIDSAMLFCDSQSAIHIATNPIFHERTKHIEVDCHFIRERVVAGFIKLIHVKSKHQLADIFTKPVSAAQFHSLIAKFGILNIYMPNLRGDIRINS